MKTFKIEERRIGFQNMERIDESLIFEEAKKRLTENNAKLSETKILPYSDIMEGEYNGVDFYLELDIDYGTELFCDDPDTLKVLESVLND